MDIKNYIDDYLNEDLYKYAILIDAAWGSGKTYQVKKYIKDNNEEYNNKKIIYISLYKINSLNMLEDKIYDQIFKRSYQKDMNVVAKNPYVKANIKLMKEIAKKMFEHKMGVNIDTSMANLKALHRESISLCDYIFMFDDLERTTCNLKDVLGFISDLIEENNSKVVIIANETEISYEKYSEIKEKTVGDTIKYKPNVEHVIKVLIDSLALKGDEDFKKILKGFLNEESQTPNSTKKRGDEIENFRGLQRFIITVDKIYAILKKERLILLNDERYNKLLNHILSIVYYKMIDKIENYKKKKDGEKKNEESINFTFLNIYLKEKIFNKEVAESECEDFIKALNKENQKDMFVAASKELDSWYEKSEEQVIKSYKKVVEQIREDKYSIFEIFEIIKKVYLITEWVKNSEINTEELLKSALESCVETSKEELLIPDPQSIRINISVLENAKLEEKIKSDYDKIIEKVKEHNQKNIKINPKERFEVWFKSSQEKNLDLFDYTTPEGFIDILDKSDSKKIREVWGRIDMINIKNSEYIDETLKLYEGINIEDSIKKKNIELLMQALQRQKR